MIVKGNNFKTLKMYISTYRKHILTLLDPFFYDYKTIERTSRTPGGKPHA